MGVEAKPKQDDLCRIKKTLRCSIRTTWRCASEHRTVFSLLLLLCLLYKSSPGFFTFLLSTSPVIICTTLLLGVLLGYGGAHLPEIDEDRKAPEGISAPKFESSSRNVNIKADQRVSVPAMEESIIREASFGRRDSNERIDLDENVPLLKGPDQQDERVDAAGGRPEKMLTSFPSMKDMKTYAEKRSSDAFLSRDKADEYANLFKDVHQSGIDGKEATLGLSSSSENVGEDAEMVAKPNYEGKACTDSQSSTIDVSDHRAVDGAAGKCKWGRAFSVRQRKKLADIKVETINSAVDNQLENSLYSPLARVGSHDSSSAIDLDNVERESPGVSMTDTGVVLNETEPLLGADCSCGFDPDNAERHSPGVSMTDTGPVLDETEPLLGADCSGADRIANDDSDNHSSISSHDSQADSDSDDVADNSKAKDDGEEKKDAVTEPAFLWTADDEKNVMDLGYSEMERNRRLELLMVRRKSRKNIRFEVDSVGGITDDLSRFRPQLQPLSVSARRMNPFADDAEIPGSAPPILHPQKSPFDFLTEQSTETGVPSCHNLEPMAVSHQDTLFKRHESFNFGRPPQRHGPRFKPCFDLEEFSFDEAGASSFQRQFSDRSVSRLSAVSECDTVSSVGDQEHNDLIRNYIRGVRESPSLLGQDSDLVHAGNECSDGISFVDNESVNAVIC